MCCYIGARYDGTCPAHDTCSVLNRNNSVPMCGECMDGYSIAVGSNMCVKDTECGTTFLSKMLIPLWMLYMSGYVAYCVLQPQVTDGLIRNVLYFFQMVTFVTVNQTPTQVVVSSLSNFQPHGTSGVCIAASHNAFFGISSVGNIMMGYLPPVMVTFLLSSSFAVQYYSKPAAAHEKLKRNYVKASTDAFLLTANTFFATSLDLVDCVGIGNTQGVSNSKRYLYQAGSVECYQSWQWFIWVLLLGGLGGVMYFVLWLNRAILVFNEHGGHHPSLFIDAFIRRISSAYKTSAGPKDVVGRSSMHNSLLDSNSFSVLKTNWEIVLLLERTCLIILSVSIHSENLTREIVVTAWCFFMLASHVAISPFADPSVNSMQTAFLTILLMVSFLNIPKATFDAAGMNPSIFIQHSFASIDYVEAILLLLPLVPTTIFVLNKQRRNMKEKMEEFKNRGSTIQETLLDKDTLLDTAHIEATEQLGEDTDYDLDESAGSLNTGRFIIPVFKAKTTRTTHTSAPNS
jgi:hypothetical protein